MKTIIQCLLASSLLLLCTLSHAQRLEVFEVLERAAEVSELTLKANAAQTVYAKRCDECPTLALSVGPETQYYNGNRAITLSRVAGQTHNATVFFNAQTRRVTRILFWQ
ncbi:MAG: hypothetical protein AB8G16_08220 [Gammaproteobacteria bacterium]